MKQLEFTLSLLGFFVLLCSLFGFLITARDWARCFRTNRSFLTDSVNEHKHWLSRHEDYLVDLGNRVEKLETYRDAPLFSTTFLPV